MSEAMMWLLVRGVWETLAMTFVSGFFGFVIGLPVGVLLYVTRPGQIMENARLYRSLSAVVNIFRSIPFIILLVWMIPFTRIIVGTSIGLQAAIVPLTVGAGGLGQIGYQYGYIGYNATVMNTVLVLLVVLVYLIQLSGDRIVRAVTHK
ncbi:hypothetical protein U5C90_001201 [Salmonella enterica]|nr:hypothetical protein [Salmonella enterica]